MRQLFTLILVLIGAAGYGQKNKTVTYKGYTFQDYTQIVDSDKFTPKLDEKLGYKFIKLGSPVKNITLKIPKQNLTVKDQDLKQSKIFFIRNYKETDLDDIKFPYIAIESFEDTIHSITLGADALRFYDLTDTYIKAFGEPGYINSAGTEFYWESDLVRLSIKRITAMAYIQYEYKPFVYKLIEAKNYSSKQRAEKL